MHPAGLFLRGGKMHVLPPIYFLRGEELPPCPPRSGAPDSSYNFCQIFTFHFISGVL